MKRKTVAIISECYGATGKGLWPVELSKAINKVYTGFNTKLFMRDDAPYYSDNVIKVKTFKTKKRGLIGLGYYLPLFFKLLRKNSIDLIHAYDEKTTALMSFLNKPLIATVPDITPLTHYKFPFNFIFRRVYGFLKKADKIIAISDSTRNKFIEKFPNLSEKTVTIHLGVDTKRFKPVKKKRKETINIGMLGTLYPEIWEVFEKLLQIYKEKIKIFVAGRPLPKKLKFLEKNPNVIIKGFVKEPKLPKYYQNIDIFVYHSSVEGFGFIPLEAMASGCAVVSSNVDSLPEVIQKGGILVNNQKEEFYNAIKKLIEDKKLRGKYQKQGRQRAKQLTWEKCAKKHTKLYKKILNKKNV